MDRQVGRQDRSILGKFFDPGTIILIKLAAQRVSPSSELRYLGLVGWFLNIGLKKDIYKYISTNGYYCRY